MTTTAPPRRPSGRAATRPGRGPGPGAARAEAFRGTPLEAPSRPSLRVVRPPRRFRPRLLGTIAVTIGFITLFVLAAMQAVLVQGQLKLDQLHGEIGARETTKASLQVKVDQLEAPDRLAKQAKALGMVPPPEVLFLYASPPAPSPEGAAAGATTSTTTHNVTSSALSTHSAAQG